MIKRYYSLLTGEDRKRKLKPIIVRGQVPVLESLENMKV